MKRHVMLVLLSVGLFFMSIQSGTAMDVQNLRITTMPMGSSWYVYGGVIGSVLRSDFPSGSKIDILPYAGAAANYNLVSDGKAELGLGFPVTGSWAYRGEVVFDKKMTNLRGLVGGLDEYYIGIVATKKSKITSLWDVSSKKMPVHLATMTKGSIGEILNGQVMGAVDASFDTIRSFGGRVTHTSYGNITKMLVDNQADLHMHVVTVGHPNMSEIAITAEVVFLSIPPEALKKLSAVGWTPATLPANTFKGQTTPISTIGTTTNLFTTNKLPDDVAYAITKSICENSKTIATGHAGLKTFNPAKAWKPENVGLPLHPGAEKYYREKGWMK
jgi:TRAP transporter TAXI family solute receptor